MESIDDPLTDSQKTSTNTTYSTLPTSPTSLHLQPNPGPPKAGRNTSSCRAPGASWKQQGLITQPEIEHLGTDCFKDPLLPWTLEKRLSVKHLLYPVTGSSWFGGLLLFCYLSLGQNVASNFSPLLSACCVN